MEPEDIAKAVNKIIDEIHKADRAAIGAINWGDIGCSKIREIREVWPYSDNSTYYEVTVEEAAPYGNEFAEQIELKMAEEYGIVISMRVKW